MNQTGAHDNPVSDAPSLHKIADPQAARRGVLASLGWLGGGLLVGRALQFVVTIYLTRVLRVEAFGLFNFVQAFLWFGVILTDFGLSPIGTREVAHSPQRLRSLAAAIPAWRLGVFAVEMLLLAAVLPALHVGSQLGWLFFLSFLSLLAYAVTADWIFRGHERMEYVAGWEALPRLIWLVGLLLFVHGPDDLLKVPLVRFAGEIVVAAGLLVIAWRRYPDGRPDAADLRASDLRALLPQAAPIVVAGLLAQVYYNFDTILLGILKTDQIVGWYSAAYRIVTLLMTGAFLLGAAYQPILARTFATDRAAFALHLRRLSAGRSCSAWPCQPSWPPAPCPLCAFSTAASMPHPPSPWRS